MLRSRKWREYTGFYMFVSPWLLIFVSLSAFPLLYGLYLSLTNYTGFNMSNLRWVGLANYKTAFEDTDSIYALGRTLLLTVIVVPTQLFLGLFMAILLNQKIRALSWFRTIFYMPSIVPVVSIALMFKFLFAGTGVVNELLQAIGLEKVNWLGYDFATATLILMLLWGSGGSLLVNLAGLKGIPTDLYEAASIDGAGIARKFMQITLPLITPFLFFNMIMGLIYCLQIYMQPILLSGNRLLDSPIRPNYLFLVHGFQQIFAFQRFGYGLALMWILFLTILLLTIVVFTSSRYWVHYEKEM